ncbi:MAG: endonuclease III domain-containing protein [Acidobacteriota bacterium]|nr:endonuclease III domain-containing protein [Acidobacteriota bacterium]
MTNPKRLIPYYQLARQWRDLSDWWPGETPWDVAVSAVLTQNTQWSRAFRALQDLRQAGLDTPDAVARAQRSVLERLVRPAGSFRRKAQTIQALARFVVTECGGHPRRLSTWPLDRARSALLAIHGIGPETADAILLYACGVPVAVVDAYTVRILQRHGLLPAGRWRYEDVQHQMETWFSGDAEAWKELHAQMVTVGRTFCKARGPLCMACPWRPLLPEGRPDDGVSGPRDRVLGLREGISQSRPVELGRPVQ